MAFTKHPVQPPPRDPSLTFDDRGPGLYADESLLLLDSGELVAVSVVPRWLEVGAGVGFTAWARATAADGATLLDAHGQHVETAFTFNADATMVERLGVPSIAKEMLLAVLGEPPTLLTLEGDERPVIPWAQEVRANASIRSALRAVSQSGPTAIDPAALLGAVPAPAI